MIHGPMRWRRHPPRLYLKSGNHLHMGDPGGDDPTTWKLCRLRAIAENIFVETGHRLQSPSLRVGSRALGAPLEYSHVWFRWRVAPVDARKRPELRGGGGRELFHGFGFTVSRLGVPPAKLVAGHNLGRGPATQVIAPRLARPRPMLTAPTSF